MIAVLVVDMQNAYFEDPALHGQRDELTAACNALINAAADANGKALLVKTEHESDKSTWTLNMLDDDQGFIFRGSEQADFVPGLLTDGVPQLVKTRDSAFVGTDLLLRLRNWSVETIVLAGVSTHNCIAQTGADAFAHNLRVIYASEGTGSEDAAAAQATQTILSREYRQRILPVSQIRELLNNPSAAFPGPRTPR
ncbi:nicotinamidase-related amidase [Arthrobacter sp. V4I6]|uniref:cysteine hydrolase family protein n=1 Tax=unclassified Arthrobacter TaxID=235627 RepID=UPI00278A08E5|nr:MULTISPECIES: isochorismatase family cysteine hydrolase [unclassified Arthrobacter]MDQ0819588.1 nicotinamidase-related amidase [Arthrobacter sp. V1I7]MDQ0853767.1 nicotinamidase-related amidase [Arthrobacter sp. V4I6]